MCGIAGLISKAEPINPRLVTALERAIEAQRHRGPDDGGIYSDEHVVLGSRRLAIIDLSPSGKQPLCNEDGTVWIAFNGEIYNFSSLRDDLIGRGHIFRSHTDTEVIVHLYEEYGAACVTHLRGMFAFAVWDKRTHTLLLVRDRLGIKPVYYSETRDHFLFASEVGSLLASGLVPKSVNRESFFRFLEWGSIPAPLTTVENVLSLPAGHYLLYDFHSRKMELERYWDIDFSSDHSLKVEEVVERTRSLLQEATQLHLLSDVPVGVFLSGGMDSSSLTALASQERSDPVKTIAVVFEEEQFSEANYVRLIVDRYATDHTEVLCTAREFLDEVPAVLQAMDQPTVDGINTYFVSRAARRAGLKVVLSGLGGDEVFWGYSHMRDLARLSGSLALFGKLPFTLRKTVVGALKTYGRMSNHPAWRKLESFNESTSENLYMLVRGLYPPSRIKTLLGADPSSVHEDAYSAGFNYQGLTTLSYLEFKRYLQNQLLKDADFMSMAHSIEVRVPFLDHRLVEYLAGVPSRMKLDPKINKILLAKAMGDLLPQEIYRRPKRGFVFPFDRWLRRYHRELRDIARSSYLFDREAVDQVWSDFENHRLHWSRPWALVVLAYKVANMWRDTLSVDFFRAGA